MALKLTNNATSTLAGSINAAVTSLSVQSGHGALFPALAAGEWFPATLKDASGNMEVVHVTARATDAFTIVRAQEGTAALSWASGSRIDLRLTEAALAAMVLQGALSSIEVTNLGLACSVATSNLTIALKQSDGTTDPTRAKPVIVGMPNVTTTSGGFLQRFVAAALSLTVLSGATLGQTSAVAAELYVYLIDNAGTLELAVAGYDAGDSGIVSTTAMTTGSDSAAVMYSAVARSSVPFRKIGRLTNTQATAGTWATVPSVVKLAPFALAESTYFKTLKAAADASALQTLLGASAFFKTLFDDADQATALATLGALAAGGGTMTGLLRTPGIGSHAGFTVADDAAGNFGDVSPTSTSLVIIWRYGGTTGPAIATAFLVRTTASPICLLAFGFSTNVDVTTSDVTGTTGVDGRVTVSATSGSLKVENRSGSALALSFLALRAS